MIIGEQERMIRAINMAIKMEMDGWLLTWLSKIHIPPKLVFVTYGEEHAAGSLSKVLSEKTGLKTYVLKYLKR